MLIGVLGMRVLRSAPAFAWSSRAPLVRGLAFAGRWSLIVYLIHQPILFGIVTPLANWVNSAEQVKQASFTQSCTSSCLAGKGKSEGAGGPQFCTAYCRCALDMHIRTEDPYADCTASAASPCHCFATARRSRAALLETLPPEESIRSSGRGRSDRP